MDDMRTETILVTPEIATAWLSVNPINRHKRPKRVQDYAVELRQGKWMLSHQGIAFDEDGLLLDGQHRLMAVELTGIAAPMRVTFNAPRASFKVLDQGAKRSIADALSLRQRDAEVLTVLARGRTERFKGLMAADEVGEMQAHFGSLVAELGRFCTHVPKVTGAAPVRAMVVLRASMGEKKWAFETYRDYVAMRFEQLPPNVNSLIRQMVNSQHRLTAMNQMTRAWLGFDRKRADNTKLLVKDVDNVCAEISEAINSIVSPPVKRSVRASVSPLIGMEARA